MQSKMKSNQAQTMGPQFAPSSRQLPKEAPAKNNIFPKKVVASKKPETGRTQSLPINIVGLPDAQRWQKIKQKCDEGITSPVQAILQPHDSRPVFDQSPGVSSQNSGDLMKPPPQYVLTGGNSNNASHIVHPIFGMQAPIISGGTNAAYSAGMIQQQPSRVDVIQEALGSTLKKELPRQINLNILQRVEGSGTDNEIPVVKNLHQTIISEEMTNRGTTTQRGGGDTSKATTWNQAQMKPNLHDRAVGSGSPKDFETILKPVIHYETSSGMNRATELLEQKGVNERATSINSGCLDETAQQQCHTTMLAKKTDCRSSDSRFKDLQDLTTSLHKENEAVSRDRVNSTNNQATQSIGSQKNQRNNTIQSLNLTMTGNHRSLRRLGTLVNVTESSDPNGTGPGAKETSPISPSSGPSKRQGPLHVVSVTFQKAGGRPQRLSSSNLIQSIQSPTFPPKHRMKTANMQKGSQRASAKAVTSSNKCQNSKSRLDPTLMLQDHHVPTILGPTADSFDQTQRQMSGRNTHRSSMKPKSDQSNKARGKNMKPQMSSEPNLAQFMAEHQTQQQPSTKSHPQQSQQADQNSGGDDEKNKTLFLMKGCQAPVVNSQTSSYYAQIKQKQIKLDESLQTQEIQQRNLFNLRYQQQQARAALRHKQGFHPKLHLQDKRIVDRSNQTSKNQSHAVAAATTQTTMKAEDVYRDEVPSDLNYGMIDKDSKIVVVRNATDSATSPLGNTAIKTGQKRDSSGQPSPHLTGSKQPPFQVHYLGQERKLVSQNSSFNSDKAAQPPILGAFWPESKPGSNRYRQETPGNGSVIQRPQEPHTITFQSTRKQIMSQRQPRTTRTQKDKVILSADPTRAVLEQTSTNSLLSRPSNMLSQVLGITTTSPKQSPRRNNNIQVALSSSAMQQQLTTTGTFSSQTARELTSMRSRMMSQGAPRRKYLNQRQSIYKLMAQNLKPTSTKTSCHQNEIEGGLNHQHQKANSIIVSHEGYDMETLSNPQVLSDEHMQHTERLAGPQDRSVMVDPAQKVKTPIRGVQPKLLSSTNQQFITCEDQTTDRGDHHGGPPQKRYAITTPTLASIIQNSSAPNTTRSLMSNQRMDLPNMMSEEQAAFMISKVMTSQLLQKKEKFHKEYKIREAAGKLCSSRHLLVQENGNCGDPQEDFPISYKAESTQVKYTGTIVSEPRFDTKLQRKEETDYLKSSMSMRLKVPVQKSSFIMQLNDDPRTPYSKARSTRLNSNTLRSNDESFAMIDSHIDHLKHRGKINVKQVLKDAKKARRRRSPVKISQLLLNQGSDMVSTNLEFGGGTYPFATVGPDEGDPNKPQRRKIQILNLQQSNETINMAQEGSTEIDRVHLSTKLHPSDGGGKAVQTQDVSQFAPSLPSQEITMTSERTIPPTTMQNFSLMQQQTMQDQQDVGRKRQTRSPQPIDTHSTLLQSHHKEEVDNHQQGFISIRRNYQIINDSKTLGHDSSPGRQQSPNKVMNQNSQLQTWNPSVVRPSAAGERNTNASQANSNRHSQQKMLQLSQSPRDKAHLRKSLQQVSLKDNCIEGVGIYKENANVSFSPKKQLMMRKRVDPNTIREQNLKKQGERDKAMRISGVKMFEPQTRNSAIQSNRSSARGNGGSIAEMAAGMERRVKYENFGKNHMVGSDDSMLYDPGTALLSPHTPAMAAENLAGMNLQNFDQNEPLDSYDGISTENKSPSLLYNRQQMSLDKKGPFGKTRRSDPSLVNLVVMNSNALQNEDKGMSDRALTPVPIENYAASPLKVQEDQRII